jgi:hypothetical protein
MLVFEMNIEVNVVEEPARTPSGCNNFNREILYLCKCILISIKYQRLKNRFKMIYHGTQIGYWIK